MKELFSRRKVRCHKHCLWKSVENYRGSGRKHILAYLVFSKRLGIAMKGKTTQTTSRSRSKGATDFKRLRAMRDSEIDFSEIPKLGKSFWATAKLTLPEPKDRLTIRVDHDVVQWLKKYGKGYQTRINAILRSYMEAQSNAR